MKTHTYKRKNRKNDPNYTFYELENAVRVVREFDGQAFEHTFRRGEFVQGRTLNDFDFDGAINNNHSVYATSEELPSSNAQSLANQIDFIFQNEKSLPTGLEKDISSIVLDTQKSDTEKNSLVHSRIGQGLFRRDLFTMWGGCAVTGCTTSELLIASHIKPWCVSNDDERLSKFNGFLLVANLDKAFDSGLITFSATGEIIISPSFAEHQVVGIHSNMKIILQPEHEEFLQHHRESIFKDT